MNLLFENDCYKVHREDKFITVELKFPAATAGTSFVNGGSRQDLKYLVNHQCVEGRDHKEVGDKIHEMGQDAYHEYICEKLKLPVESTAIMSTAANMMYSAVKVLTYKELEVAALVTAGVQGNAGRAGDPANWHEEDEEWEKLHLEAGTINTLLLINWPLSPAALSRCLVTATEAKTAALLDLAVPGKYSQELATGTGTDQILAAAIRDPGKKPKNWSGKHSKLGELIGKTVLEATKESLRWQNGLEPSYTRSIMHALGRFGFSVSDLKEYLKTVLAEKDCQLFSQNESSVLFEPQVAACSFALASVLDRSHKEVFPSMAVKGILTSHAALMAVQVGGKKENYSDYYNSLSEMESSFPDQIYLAIALGWQDKWK